MKFSPHIGKLVFKLYMAMLALLIIGVAVLVAPLFTCGDAVLAVLRGDLDAALACTAEDGQWMVSRSLLNAGANPNTVLADGSPLLPAMAARGDVIMVRILLEKGADPAATDNQGRTALEIAREAQNTGLLKLLAPQPPATTPLSSANTPTTSATEAPEPPAAPSFSETAPADTTTPGSESDTVRSGGTALPDPAETAQQELPDSPAETH